MSKFLIRILCLHALFLLVLGIGTIGAADGDVGGSSTRYPIDIQSKIGDKEVKLTLTGVAMRKKAIFKVYTIGSYVEQGVEVHSAAELVAKDCAKQMNLVMKRDVDGQVMAEAFLEGVRLNYPEPKFVDQCKALLDFMKNKNLKSGDRVWLTHVSGVGFECVMPGGKTLIKDVAFAQAIWDIYLGKNNIGDEIKNALTSRLK